jgi:hypothetical protein
VIAEAFTCHSSGGLFHRQASRSVREGRISQHSGEHIATRVADRFREGNPLKKIIFLLCAVSLWGCGEGLPPSDSEVQGTLAALEQADVPGTHGYEINLPLEDRNYLPSEWYWVDVLEIGSLVFRHDSAGRGSMNWGGGNMLYNIISPSRPPRLRALIYTGSGYQVVGHITGFFNNIQPGLVRGSAELMIEQDSQPMPQNYQDLELALQVYNGTSWNDVTTRTLYTGVSPYFGEVEAVVQPYVPVRLEIRALRSSTYEKTVYFTKVRMFGAQCYPDFANPGDCL